MNKFRFENLHVWQDARNFINQIYTLTKKFPTSEKFALVDQLRRATVSIALNIAEGSDRKSDIEFSRYLRMAITSTEEVVTALYIALDQKYIQQKDFDRLYQEAHMIVAKLNALINSLRSTEKQNGSRKSEVGRPRNGFTLIELLVAISIIAVLSTIGLNTFSTVQSKARDSVRKNDLNTLAIALEVYFQKNSQYIGTLQQDGSCNVTSGQFYSEITAQINGPVPKDPKTGTEYLYAAENKCQSYRLFANLENCNDPQNPLCGYQNYNFSVVSEGLTIASAPGDTIASGPAPTPTPPPPAPATPQPTPQPSSLPSAPSADYKRVFITRLPSKGNLGGLSGADQVCQTKAGAAGLSGTFKAWLSTDTIPASSRLIPYTIPFKRIDGVDIALNWADLIDGALLAPIRIDETGRDVGGGRQVWTATKTTGLFGTGNNDCNDWTTDSSGIYAYFGLSEYTKSWWTYYTGLGPSSCGQFQSLYCFEQGPGPTPAPTPTPDPTPASTPTPAPTPAPPKRVFVTSAAYNGNLGGLSGADSKCQQGADAAGLGGTWKAWLSDTGTSASSRLTHNTGQYKRTDGTIVANNWEDLILDGSLTDTINIDELGGSVSSDGVWTNTTTAGGISGTSPTNTCSSWTSTSTSRTAIFGFTNRTDFGWTYSGGENCANQNRLYCFEQ